MFSSLMQFRSKVVPSPTQNTGLFGLYAAMGWVNSPATTDLYIRKVTYDRTGMRDGLASCGAHWLRAVVLVLGWDVNTMPTPGAKLSPWRGWGLLGTGSKNEVHPMGADRGARGEFAATGCCVDWWAAC